MEFRITIVKSQKPENNNLNDELLWIAGSLGLFGLRDKDKSCFRIFIELLKNAREEKVVSSEELADKLGLTRGTVIYHINKLMDAGIVIPTKNRYMLRVNTLKNLIIAMQDDLNRQMKELQEIAEDIDKKLKLD